MQRMDENPEIHHQETTSGRCNLCGALKIQESCSVCGSLKKRDPSALGGGSGDGQPPNKKRETDSVLESRLYGLSRLSVAPQAFYPGLCRTCSDVVNFPGRELPAKSPTSQNLPWMNTNVCPPSPSPAKGGSPSTPLRRCISELHGVISSAGHGQNFPNSPQAPRINPNVAPPSPSPASSAQLTLLPVLQPSVPDHLPVASPPRTGTETHCHEDMLTKSPVQTQERPDHESQRFKRMMERVKEMKQWWETVVLEAEGDETGNDNTTEGSNTGEEEVSIERDGEYLRICLKCPCSKKYQLLISGSNCYYKLM